jgi:hypothetical protein
MVRRSKEELRAEFNRLSDIFGLFCEFERSRMSPARAAEHRSLVAGPEKMLSWVEEGKATMSQIIAGTREAINDQNEMLGYSAEAGDSFAPEFLAFYKEKTGRDYYDDAGHPRKMARMILKRNEIVDETEFRLINGIMSNVDQTVFKKDEIERIAEMLHRFETKIGGY